MKNTGEFFWLLGEVIGCGSKQTEREVGGINWTLNKGSQRRRELTQQKGAVKTQRGPSHRYTRTPHTQTKTHSPSFGVSFKVGKT